MRFYRIDALLNNPTAWKRRYEKPADRQALMEEIGAAAQRYNADRSVFERFYPTALSKDRFSFCAAAEGIVSQPDGTAFLRELDERFGKISVTEIGFGTFREALKRGDRKDLLDDADDIFKELGLEKLNDSFGHYYLDCGEGLLKKTGNTFPGLIRKAKQAMVGDSLIPELERIREGKTRTDYPGHPVHYFVETADKDLRKTLTHLLMQGLLLRKRIQNLRYTYLDVPADWNYSKEGFEELYKSSKGGVVLIRYNGGVEEDGACAGAELATINAISDMARRYRNQVLTVFCMFRGQQTSKRLLLEKIRDLRIVELKEDLVPQERAE